MKKINQIIVIKLYFLLILLGISSCNNEKKEQEHRQKVLEDGLQYEKAMRKAQGKPENLTKEEVLKALRDTTDKK